MTTTLPSQQHVVSALTASTVMTAPVVAVDATDPVAAVWTLMSRAGVSHVVVFQQDRCLGVVEVHNVWLAWAFDLQRLSRRCVLNLVTATPRVAPDTPLSLVCRALMHSADGAVLVLDDTGRLQGIITPSDVLRALATEKEPTC